MKFFILAFTVLFSTASFAHISDSNFASLIQRHKTLVNNDGDTWLNAEILKHDEHADMGDMVRKIAQDAIAGVEGINMRPFNSETPRHDLVELLTRGGYPFFCVNFEKDLDWTEDFKKCEGRLHLLLGKAPERSDRITVIEMWGNYYGDWAETVVVLQNFETKESLVLEFDLIHEI